jgi:hypothetical protein
MQLSKFENEILQDAKTYINERALASIRASRKQGGKKVKGQRKKVKEYKKLNDLPPATPIHAFEALLGALKMQVIQYLRLDCSVEEAKEMIYGLDNGLGFGLVREIRLEVCKDIVGVLDKDWWVAKSLDVHKWFFKSGFLKRSNNLFKEFHGSDGVQYAHVDDIRNLREEYMKKAVVLLTSKEEIDRIFFNNDDIGTTSDDNNFYVAICKTQKALELTLEDMDADKNFLRKAKYLNSQISTLCKLMKVHIEESSDVIKRMEEITIEVKESYKVKMEQEGLKKELGPYYRLVLASCRMEGIKLSDSTRGVWGSYFESLKGMKRRELAEERKWLGVA